MANYSYTSNGVKFSIPDNTDYLFGKLSHEYSVFEDGDITPLVNAVEIDWNGAQLGDKTLNTTGEVLSMLQDAYNTAYEANGKSTSVSFVSSYNSNTGTKIGTLTIDSVERDLYAPIHVNASASADGFMSRDAYTKLSNISASATKVSISGLSTVQEKSDIAEIIINGTSHIISVPIASSTTPGLLSTEMYSKFINNDNVRFERTLHEGVEIGKLTINDEQPITLYAPSKHNNASASADGFMSVNDWTRLEYAYSQIANLSSTIALLQEEIANLKNATPVVKTYKISFALTNCTCTNQPATISENGATLEITANTNYTLPQTIVVKSGNTTLQSGFDYAWDPTNNKLKINSPVAGDISVTIAANPVEYTINVDGSAKLFINNTQLASTRINYTPENITYTLKADAGYKLRQATVDSNAQLVSFNATTGNIVFKITSTGANRSITINVTTEEIIMETVSVTRLTTSTSGASITGDSISISGGKDAKLCLQLTPQQDAYNKNLSIEADDVVGASLSANTLTIKPKGLDALNKKVIIKNYKGASIKELTIAAIFDGKTQSVTVKIGNSTNDYIFGTNTGGKVTITGSVSSTRYTTPTIEWSCSGSSITLNPASGSSTSFTAPTNNSTTSSVEYTITATADGVTKTIKVIVPAKQEETKYYWYVGQTNPASMTSISPIVDDNTSPGWRYIGTSIPSYSETNMLWDGVTNNIKVDKESGERAQYFVAVPDNKIQIYNGLKGSEMSNYDTSEITIGGVKYYVYSYKSKGRSFGMNLY